MARTVRTRARPATGWSVIEARLVERLRNEPSERNVAGVLALLTLTLYFATLGYPLVFGDFALLGAAQLDAYARMAPVIGRNWLADASFGWSAAAVGMDWAWHRAVNIALHAVAVIVAFAVFRRILFGTAGESRSMRCGWIAFTAAALFAVHPVAVYGVAYLSARYALLFGLFALIALWGTARALQQAGRFAWLAGPLATAAALMSSPSAIAVPVAMAFLALALPACGPAGRRSAWTGVALSAVLALAYAAAWVSASPAADNPYLDGLAASGSRWLRYLGFWLVPWTSRMAIDIPEAATTFAQAWPGWLGILGFAALAASLAWVLLRKQTGLLRAAAIGIGCAAALSAVELAWPRLGSPFALPRSYAFMACALVAPACLIALLPARAAWATACAAVLVWMVAAADTLQSFSSHVALWDDAVRRAERAGPRPEDARVYLNRATLHRHDGHSLAALADYDKALALQPDSTRALRGRAQVYIDEKRYGEALRDFDRLLELEPEQAITHADRGLALMQAGRLNEAGRAFDRAIQRGVREPRVFLNRGLARLQLGGLGAAPAALADIERALELDPGYALAHYNRAVVFEQAANAGLRLRDALSPELMRTVAEQNLQRACQLGHTGACERLRAKSEQALPGGAEEAARITPEALRQRTLPPR